MLQQMYEKNNIQTHPHTNRSTPPPPVGVELGTYANKVARPDIQHVVNNENKPYRAQRLKTRYEIQKNRLALGRVLDCGKKPLGGNVEVHYNNEYNSAKIANVETCGSVWACPVCRNKILTKRADELKTIGSGFRSDGGFTCMATFTTSHNSGQSLDNVLGTHKSKKGITGAFARMRQHRRWRKIMNRIGCVADVRVIETTVGKNGWHVHIHMILYYMDSCEYVTNGLLERDIYDLWKDVCVMSGLGKPSIEHGVKISNGDDSYLAKWGSPNELTSDFAKQAKNGNMSIAEIEALLINGSKKQKIHSKIRLREYYNFFFNRKMLTWGGELNFRKSYLKEPDKTDKELALDEHGNGERLFVIAYACWKLIYRTGEVGSLLNHIEADRETGIYTFLAKNKIEPHGVYRCIKDMDIKTDSS